MTPRPTSSAPYSCAAPYTSIRSCKVGEPVELLRLPFNKDNLYFVLVNPVFEAPTAEMRAVLPKEVPMKSMINNCCQGGSLVSAGAGKGRYGAAGEGGVGGGGGGLRGSG